MVVHYLNVKGVSLFPLEANSPLLVYANAVLTAPVAGELLQAIARRKSQVLKRGRGIDDKQFTKCSLLHGARPFAHRLTLEQSPGVLIAKAPDHPVIITRSVTIVKELEAVELTPAFTLGPMIVSHQSAPCRWVQRFVRQPCICSQVFVDFDLSCGSCGLSFGGFGFGIGGSGFVF